MAHPTHLTIVVCFGFCCRALVAIMAQARKTAVEMKTLEEQREVREIEADRDVQVERTRAYSRATQARFRVASQPNTTTQQMDSEEEAEQEAAYIEKRTVSGRRRRA